MIDHPSFPLGRIAGEFYDDGRKFVTIRPFQFVYDLTNIYRSRIFHYGF